jgi:GNAT superfamily N-acetyltransferase
VKLLLVTRQSPLFDAVLRLWRSNSDTLGFMPVGGFEDAAKSGCLIAAEAEGGQLAGYVMFRRTSRGVAVIVHLCVAPSHQRSGLARALFEETRARCGDSFEIRLRCRRDFPATEMWPKLGLIAVSDEPGRGTEGTLTLWRYELAALPLFRNLPAPALGSAVRAVIDANIFFDLDEASAVEEESRSLLADWVGEFVEVAITQELFNEINRREDPHNRERQWGRARRFPEIPRDAKREEEVLPAVKALLATSETPNSLSDARQIAMTIAGSISFFVTRDGGVLAAADALEDAFGLQVMSPHEIIRRFDELRREEEYRPRRLFFGGGASVVAARAEDIEGIADLMHLGQKAPEPRRRTLGRLREMLAAPDRYEASCIRREGDLIAAYFVDRNLAERLTVPFLGVVSTALGKTAARHYGEAIVTMAAHEGRPVVRVEETGERVAEALSELGFSKEADAWVKLVLPIALSPEMFAAEVERIGSSNPPAAQLAQRVAGELRDLARGPGVTRATAFDVERALWPAKLTSSGLPCFVVPIQPRWAKELFDRELAQGTLFGAKPSLVLNSENVYYRAARPAVVSAPSRVLWYVSDDSAYPESKAVRACSYIDEVAIGLPKDLYRRFKRLGVYEWSDVFALANHDVTRPIMAFRFSKTELFKQSIGFRTMQEVIKRHTGKGQQVQSPVTLSEECFFDIYRRGVDASAA